MTERIKGLHRLKGHPGRPNDVRVTTQERHYEITESEYRQREILPFFEDLVWQTETERRQSGVIKCV